MVFTICMETYRNGVSTAMTRHIFSTPRLLIRKGRRSHGPQGAYGGRRRLSAESVAKSRYSEPVYYVFDNRGRE